MVPRPMAAVLDEDELIAIGASLSQLQGQAGWADWLSLLAKFEQDAGLRGVRDRDKPRSYYEGYLDALAEIRSATQYLIDEAKVAMEVREETDSGFVRPRLATGGSVSGI